MNSQVFREYDIRGNAERDLPDVFVKALGIAIAKQAGEASPVVVGRDCRLHSPRLHAALLEGLRCLVDVVDVGIVPTPAAYFAQQLLRPAATVMITGSHNPAEDNGFKIMIGENTLHGSGIKALEKRLSEAFVSTRVHGVTTRSVNSDYVEEAARSLRLGERRPRVVVDAGNGSGGPLAVELYTRLGFDVIPLYCEFDGRFPHHHPDPTQPENLADLITAVRHTGAELGLALDGDADRLGVVDEQGRILWGDQIMILLGKELLREVPEARFIGEVKCSQALYNALPCEMWKVGHSLIKERMKETGALLAGEMSGHLFFAHRWFGFDDGIYAGARLLELLSRTDKKLTDLVSELPVSINTPEIRVECPDDRKFSIIECVTDSLQRDSQIRHVITIDGVRARFFNGGWGLVRASNTQPALVVRCEADSLSDLKTVQNVMERHIEKAKVLQGASANT